jgi:phospholipid/cholesterol/gamma-HCH transport system ATP-binding protein
VSDAGDCAPILEIEAARTEGDGGPPVSLTLHAGELVAIEAAERGRAEAFADLCTGLAPLAEGWVRFLGRAWAELRPEQANALRGRIGRVFAVGGWIPHFSVAANVLLPQLYHSHMSEAVLRESAAALAQAFGLPGLPLGPAADQTPADLARAACVRAFLGEPSFILI